MDYCSGEPVGASPGISLLRELCSCGDARMNEPPDHRRTTYLLLLTQASQKIKHAIAYIAVNLTITT